MPIRAATPDDSGLLRNVLRRSITVLCSADHGGDPDTIQQWLANKTHHNVRAWIEDPGQRVAVADLDEAILGVGAATASGEITLNYVAPEARFRGVSKAILQDLEAYLCDCGQGLAKLSSTRTAHRFYLAAGYRNAGPPQRWGRLSAQPMTKPLV
jgi:GNAT superfamily N-acetyltransferase